MKPTPKPEVRNSKPVRNPRPEASAIAPIAVRPSSSVLRPLTLPLLALLQALAGSPVHATDYVWMGYASTSWAVPTNWVPMGVPGPNDSAVVNRSVDLAGNVTVSNLTLTTGGSSQNGNLTILGTMNWSGGGFSSVGLTFSTGAVLHLNGADVKDLHLSALTNHGTVQWTGTGALSLMGTPIESDSPGPPSPGSLTKSWPREASTQCLGLP